MVILTVGTDELSFQPQVFRSKEGASLANVEITTHHSEIQGFQWDALTRELLACLSWKMDGCILHAKSRIFGDKKGRRKYCYSPTFLIVLFLGTW